MKPKINFKRAKKEKIQKILKLELINSIIITLKK